MRTILAPALGAVLACGATARAQHAGDILLSIVNGQIATGAIESNGTLDPSVGVFESVMGAAAPGFTDTPGFDCLPGTFPVPSTNGFRIRKALRKWVNGNFDTIPPEVISVTFGPLGPVNTPPADTVVTGFSLAVGSNGQWHRHLGYSLGPPQSDGVYLMEMSIFSSRAEIAESRPFWLVFGSNAAQPDLDAAAAWVRLHLACPADFNGSGSVTVQDIFDFLGAYFTAAPAADFNGSGSVTVQDIFDFLNAYFTGCAG